MDKRRPAGHARGSRVRCAHSALGARNLRGHRTAVSQLLGIARSRDPRPAVAHRLPRVLPRRVECLWSTTAYCRRARTTRTRQDLRVRASLVAGAGVSRVHKHLPLRRCRRKGLLPIPARWTGCPCPGRFRGSALDRGAGVWGSRRLRLRAPNANDGKTGRGSPGRDPPVCILSFHCVHVGQHDEPCPDARAPPDWSRLRDPCDGGGSRADVAEFRWWSRHRRGGGDTAGRRGGVRASAGGLDGRPGAAWPFSLARCIGRWVWSGHAGVPNAVGQRADDGGAAALRVRSALGQGPWPRVPSRPVRSHAHTGQWLCPPRSLRRADADTPLRRAAAGIAASGPGPDVCLDGHRR